MKRRWLLTLYDTHAGHKLGQCNPDAVIHEEDEAGNIVTRPVELGAFQKYLWALYLDCIARVREYVGKDDLVIVHGGDVTQGIGHCEHLMSFRISDHIAIAVANLLPLMELPNVRTVRIVKGTGVHSLGEGSSEILVSEQLKTKYPKKDIGTFYHGLLDIGGVTFNPSHRGPPVGRRNWLKGNDARAYLRSLMLDDLGAGARPPRVVLRGHYHDYVHEYLEIEYNGTLYKSDLVVLPSLCGIDDYGRQASRSVAYQVQGVVLFEIRDGELGRIIPLKKTLDVRTRETL